MFWFTVMLNRPKGEALNTFFIGKIRGTFVDDFGTTGVWTAVIEK